MRQADFLRVTKKARAFVISKACSFQLQFHCQGQKQTENNSNKMSKKYLKTQNFDFMNSFFGNSLRQILHSLRFFRKFSSSKLQKNIRAVVKQSKRTRKSNPESKSKYFHFLEIETESVCSTLESQFHPGMEFRSGKLSLQF